MEFKTIVMAALVIFIVGAGVWLHRRKRMK